MKKRKKLTPVQMTVLGTIVVACIMATSAIISSFIQKLPPFQPFPTPTYTLTSTSTPHSVETPHPIITPLPPTITGKISYFREGTFVISDSLGRNEAIVFNRDQNILCAAISPNGEKIAYTSSSDKPVDVFVVNKDGTELVNLSKHNGYPETCMAWSPDNSKLLFVRQYSIESDILLVNTFGSAPINLTNTFETNSQINYISMMPWSPDTKDIVFYSNRDGDFEIYILNLKDGSIKQITSNTFGDYDAVWSPDGQKLAFVSEVSGSKNSDIYVFDFSSNSITNVTNNLSHNTDPVWSPDGTKILFASDRDGNNELFMMNSNGTNIVKVTNTIDREERPNWLP